MLKLHDLRTVTGDYRSVLPQPTQLDGTPLETVRSIIEDVRSRGDRCLIELGERFDGSKPDPLKVDMADCHEALGRIDKDLRHSLEVAAKSIETFHKAEIHEPATHNHNGLSITGWRQPVDRAGCYVPGGLGAYPSTVLMTAVIAKAAGVKEVALCVPPTKTGRIADVVLAAAAIAQVDNVYAVGGAQAIAALAYGTETVKAVDVIVGPGNKYVALAKQEVSGVVSVPSAFTGPSEICVIADDSANPDFVAIDLMVQAEHGPDGLSWLITDSEQMLEAVQESLSRLVPEAVRRADIEANLMGNGHAAIVKDLDQGVEVANAIAPEHLQFMVANAENVLSKVRHAGAVFVGGYTPASIGDYVAGPSHCLPTNGSARFGGALGIDDFTKLIHVVHGSRQSLRWAAQHVENISLAEGLPTHCESVRMRLRDINSSCVDQNASNETESGL